MMVGYGDGEGKGDGRGEGYGDGDDEGDGDDKGHGIESMDCSGIDFVSCPKWEGKNGVRSSCDSVWYVF